MDRPEKYDTGSGNCISRRGIRRQFSQRPLTYTRHAGQTDDERRLQYNVTSSDRIRLPGVKMSTRPNLTKSSSLRVFSSCRNPNLMGILDQAMVSIYIIPIKQTIVSLYYFVTKISNLGKPAIFTYTKRIPTYWLENKRRSLTDMRLLSVSASFLFIIYE